jgi:hypothetical protein
MNYAIVITDALGGASATARFFGIAQPSVSEWRTRGVIPRARLRHLQDVRPDILPEHLRRPTDNERGAA